MSDTDQRLERLETNVAHLERQVEQMNQALVEQDKLLAHLKKRVTRQDAAVETLELERIQAKNPRPPHY